MGYKVFVSYKYKDYDVKHIDGGTNGTARDYVDYLQARKFSGDDLNMAESGDEDLSEFKDETIQTHLKDKIWGSSITLVLISPNMVDNYNSKSEEDQWIPWEVSYSLRTQTKAGRRSRPNALIAVVLPNISGQYNYFVSYNTYTDRNNQKRQVQSICTGNTFEIIRNNMFNQKNPNIEEVDGHKIYHGDSCYITTVEWEDFINDMESYFDKAIELRDKISEYNIQINVKKRDFS